MVTRVTEPAGPKNLRIGSTPVPLNGLVKSLPWRVASRRVRLRLTGLTKWEETMRIFMRLLGLAPAVGALLMPLHAARAQVLITGNDEKVSFDENTGKMITHPAGKDTVSIIDIADPAKPKIVLNLPLMNTI